MTNKMWIVLIALIVIAAVFGAIVLGVQPQWNPVASTPKQIPEESYTWNYSYNASWNWILPTYNFTYEKHIIVDKCIKDNGYSRYKLKNGTWYNFWIEESSASGTFDTVIVGEEHLVGFMIMTYDNQTTIGISSVYTMKRVRDFCSLREEYLGESCD